VADDEWDQMKNEQCFGELHWLEGHGQRLGLMPTAGGGVAAWQWQRGDRPVDLWRPWDGRTARMQALASYPLLPWSNRISGGGFEHAGRFHTLAPNTPDDPYPIHGDGWLQPWQLTDIRSDRAQMHLRSEQFGGGPYRYEATQVFNLVDGGMTQSLAVVNQGELALPFGLGQHPWFTRTPLCRVSARVQGVWLARPDKIPTGFSETYPEGWNLNQGAKVDHIVIDNGFGGWDGEAKIEWPERDLTLHMSSLLTLPDGSQLRPDCLLYAPAEPAVFCFEPISHPIDAAHMPEKPGWFELAPGETLTLKVDWRFGATQMHEI
jgi:aldose 1-epimerase